MNELNNFPYKNYSGNNLSKQIDINSRKLEIESYSPIKTNYDYEYHMNPSYKNYNSSSKENINQINSTLTRNSGNEFYGNGVHNDNFSRLNLEYTSFGEKSNKKEEIKNTASNSNPYKYQENNHETLSYNYSEQNQPDIKYLANNYSPKHLLNHNNNTSKSFDFASKKDINKNYNLNTQNQNNMNNLKNMNFENQVNTSKIDDKHSDPIYNKESNKFINSENNLEYKERHQNQIDKNNSYFKAVNNLNNLSYHKNNLNDINQEINSENLKKLNSSLKEITISEAKLRDQVIKKDKHISDLENSIRDNEQIIMKLKRIHIDKDAIIEDYKLKNSELNIVLKNLNEKVRFILNNFFTFTIFIIFSLIIKQAK
jgi:hypothetical protein